jgi:transcriptional regulator GlxA family with amidase domain
VSLSVRHSDHHAATGIRASASRVAPLHDGLVAALRLISREAGERLARDVVEHFPVALHTAPGSLLDEVSASTRADRMRAAARWLQDNCHRPVSVEDVADVTAMSRRSLLRHFRQETGMAPSEYLLHARLALACRFLSETDLPADKIARRVGMSNGDHLAKVFRRNLRLSPLEYRHRYLRDRHDAEAGGLIVVGGMAIRGASSACPPSIDQLLNESGRSLLPERKPASDGSGS